MARYDRTFLVPYLNDICTLQLSKKKVKEKIEEERAKIEQIKQKAMDAVPMPEMAALTKNDASCGAILLGLLVEVMALGALLKMFLSFSSLAKVLGYLALGLVLSISGWIIMGSSSARRARNNEKTILQNEERLKAYEQAKIAAVKDAQPYLSVVEGRIEFYNDEIAKIDGLLQELYDARVIAKWYRDLYPAVYLDDWFSNSRSDDLDMALNTFVLEEIKEKLDVIIKNQGEELINQRIMIANQEKSMEQREEHHRALMSKLDEIQATNEERNSYLRMINANTATSAFFAEASYLRA